MNNFFGLKQYHTTFKREVLAGVTSFLTIAYGFFLIPKMLQHLGLDFPAAVTASIIVGIFGTLMLALFANFPFIVAPGVAVAVYIAYGMVPREMISPEIVLALTFLSGLILWVFNTFGVRVLIIQTIPHAIRTCTTVGLGLLLAIVGLKNGGFLIREKEIYAFDVFSNFSVIVVLISLLVTVALIRYKVPGSYFIGVLVAWVIAAASGKIEVDSIVSLPNAPALFKLNLYALLDIRFISPIISLMFILLFDSTGTVVALCHRCERVEHVGPQCKIPGVIRVFACDSLASMLAGIVGSSPGSIYLESAAGISAGGRTGLTALVTALCFCVLLFFTPLFASIPLYATSAALILIGGSMVGQLIHMPWNDPTEWVPGFFTFILIPFTFNVALGIGVGYLTYIILKFISLKLKDVHWFSWIMGMLFLAWFVVLKPLKIL